MKKRKKRSFRKLRNILVMLSPVLIIILVLLAFNKEKVHTYKAVVTTEGSCSAPGVRTFTCVRCGYTCTEPIVTGHDYAETMVIPADAKKYISCKCRNCGSEKNIKDLGESDAMKNPYSLVSAAVTGVEKSYQFTGGGITPVPVVTDKNGNTLAENTDYTVSYEHNTEAGIGTVRLTGKGLYRDACEIHFSISEAHWDETDGLKSYYEDGKVTGLKEIDGNEYYFDEEGIMQTGWQKFDDGYYCFDRLTGELAKSTMVDGIKVDAKGKAEDSEYNTYKIETMMKAHQIVLEQTSPKDSMEDKRLKLFNWEMKEHGYHRWRLLSAIYDSSPDWEITFANDIFDKGSGCCVSDSCATAFLFREIGYTNIYVCHDTSHCWFTVDGKLFDPLFAEGKSFYDNYNANYTDYREHPVGRRRIDGVSTDDGSDESDEETAAEADGTAAELAAAAEAGENDADVITAEDLEG